LEVRDEGEGIAPDILPKVMAPFFTTKRDRGGTGLGLALSARIAKEHGATLDITSSPNEGTIARLSLPTDAGLPILEHA